MGASWLASSGGDHPSSGGANQTNAPLSTYHPIALQWSGRPKELHSQQNKQNVSARFEGITIIGCCFDSSKFPNSKISSKDAFRISW